MNAWLEQDNLFKRLKLKHDRIPSMINTENNPICRRQSVQLKMKHVTPDIDDLHREENALMQRLRTPQLDTHRWRLDQRRLFHMCAMCNDRATGIHYGLTTCEGCKGQNWFDRFSKDHLSFRFLQTNHSKQEKVPMSRAEKLYHRQISTESLSILSIHQMSDERHGRWRCEIRSITRRSNTTEHHPIIPSTF